MADGVLKIKVTAPPVDGEANAAVIALLAKEYGISKSDIHIVQGQTGKNKRIEIDI